MRRLARGSAEKSGSVASEAHRCPVRELREAIGKTRRPGSLEPGLRGGEGASPRRSRFGSAVSCLLRRQIASRAAARRDVEGALALLGAPRRLAAARYYAVGVDRARRRTIVRAEECREIASSVLERRAGVKTAVLLPAHRASSAALELALAVFRQPLPDELFHGVRDAAHVSTVVALLRARAVLIDLLLEQAAIVPAGQLVLGVGCGAEPDPHDQHEKHRRDSFRHQVSPSDIRFDDDLRTHRRSPSTAVADRKEKARFSSSVAPSPRRHARARSRDDFCRMAERVGSRTGELRRTALSGIRCTPRRCFRRRPRTGTSRSLST